MNTLFAFGVPCEFIAGAASIESLPPEEYPEVCFIGRSNVGKSSLINALTHRSELARISANPGHTKQLNFFLLADRLMLVDMPGYGYAKVSKTQKGEWDNLIHSYLRGRPNLKRICLLIDARRGVMKVDEEFMTQLDDAAVTYQIVLTKADLLSKTELSKQLQSLEETIKSHAAAHPQALPTSSETKSGLEALQDELSAFAME